MVFPAGMLTWLSAETLRCDGGLQALSMSYLRERRSLTGFPGAARDSCDMPVALTPSAVYLWLPLILDTSHSISPCLISLPLPRSRVRSLYLSLSAFPGHI